MPDSRKPLDDVSETGTSEERLLEELRENYDNDTEAFKEIRDEGSTDIRFVANDPWPEKEKQNRRDKDRPILSIDQLNQYTNLVINEIRQHPREIKISPAGYGATAQLAELRENRIRAIQYKSDAQAAYVTAMENACQRSYGVARVSLRYLDEKSFDQEIYIRRVPNPDAVLFDSNCKELDCSDAGHCFVLDQIPKKQFRREYPKAEVTDFQGAVAREYPQWIKEKNIQIAEYWRVKKQPDELVQFDGGVINGEEIGPVSDFVSKLKTAGAVLAESAVIFPNGNRLPIINSRKTHIRKVSQYITNGVEILETNAWLGKWIPLVPIFGKELYVSDAAGSKRILLSLIRNARDAQMAFNYGKTCQIEAVGMVPKTNYLAIEGQFEGHEEELADAHKNPRPFTYYKAFAPDIAPGVQLPPPIREPFDPPIQNLELFCDSAARSIQTAVGMYNTATGRLGEKDISGRAIKELDEQSDLGAFHFIANYNRFITAIGRIVNDLQSKIEVTPRQVSVRSRDGKDKLIWINKPFQDESGQEQHHDMTLGEYDVTVSVGPNADSQREAAGDFIDKFVENISTMGFDPQTVKALTALMIQIKQMGPIADQMVKILQPEQDDPATLQANLQQMQAQLEQLQIENAALHEDRAGRVLEQQTKVQVKDMELKAKAGADAAQHLSDQALAQMQADIKVLVALISAKNQQAEQEAEMYKQFWIENHGAAQHVTAQAHELAMQKDQQAHEKDLAQQASQVQLAPDALNGK